MRFLAIASLIASLLPSGFAQAVSEGNFGAAEKAAAPAKATAAAKREPAVAEPKPISKPKPKTYPYHGTLEAIADDGRTFNLRGKSKPRRIVITSETRIWRDGEKALLSDAIAGERVTGSVFRNADGQEQALTLRLAGSKSAD